MRPLPSRSRLLVVLVLATLPLACGADHGSLGDLATDSGSGGESGTSDGTGDGSGSSETGTGTTDSGCAIQLADVAAGIGGFLLEGETDFDYAGNSVSGTGDINGDGLVDVIVGAPQHISSLGQAYVVFGKSDTTAVALADVAQGTGGFALDGESDTGYGSLRASGAGDINGDGLDDVIVGAWAAYANGLFSGRTYVVFGTADAESVSLTEVAQGTGGFVLDGEAEYDYSGCSAAGAGDINGDGLDDVVIGAHRADANGVGDSGRAYVVFGKTDTQTVQLADVALGSGGFAIDGETEGDESGHSVSGAGDVDGDGLADVIVGAFGRADVVFGKADTAPVSLADVAQGNGGFVLDGSNSVVSGAGDVNGDGLADVIVGAPTASPTGVESGRTYVVFGKAGTEAVSLADVAQGNGGFAMDGEAAGDESGGSVSGAGDVNADGLADVIVGASGALGHDPDQEDGPGRTYLVFGKAGTDRVALEEVAMGIGGFVLDGEAAGDRSGGSVSGAGDINGDGVPDLIIGASHASPNGYNSGRTYVVFGGDFSCAEGGG